MSLIGLLVPYGNRRCDELLTLRSGKFVDSVLRYGIAGGSCIDLKLYRMKFLSCRWSKYICKISSGWWSVFVGGRRFNAL